MNKKGIKDNIMKKLIAIIGTAMLLATAVESKAVTLLTTLSVSATTNATNVAFTGPARVAQVVVLSSTANDVRLYDTTNTTLKWVNAAYSYATNISVNITNLTTNAIYVYPTSTQIFRQTNIFLAANIRTNISVAANTNDITAAVAIGGIANIPVTLDDADLTFVNGITIRTTNACQIFIYKY